MQKNFSQLYYFVHEYKYLNLVKLKKNTHIIYRDYKKNTDTSTLILLKKFCKLNNSKLFLSNNIRLAIRHKLDGIYIPSFNKQINYINCSIPKHFEVIGSAHNSEEVSIKYKQGCKLVFLSPIFKVNKKNNFLNITRFNLVTLNKKVKFIALGGINSNNLRKLNLLNITGIAGISYFQKKTAPQRGR
tara:strand:- start:1405 stop:1965 length:561 start_codon:yes stop_codon:yes gene_type:complete